MEFELPDEHGKLVSLANLAGYLVIVTELPLANGQVRETTMRGVRALRKRLRGLGSTVVFVSLCHGGQAADLTALLDTWTARKPVNVFLLDDERAVMDELRAYGRSPSADWFLIDRHARIRGAYGVEEAEASLVGDALARNTAANRAEVDRLVYQAGQLANWMGSDEANDETADEGPR
jgi:peroxiredoxin